MAMKKLTLAALSTVALAACTNAMPPVTATSEVARVENMQASGSDTVRTDGSKVEGAELHSALADQAAPVGPRTAFPQTGQRAARPYLPTEQGLLRQHGIALESVMPLLASPHFDKSVNSLAREAARDPDAQQMTRIYAQEATLALEGQGQLAGLSCGLSVCMGAARLKSKEAASEWANSFADRKTAPSYSFVSDITQVGASQYEARFVFSTDPAANSLTGVVKPGRQRAAAPGG